MLNQGKKPEFMQTPLIKDWLNTVYSLVEHPVVPENVFIGMKEEGEMEVISIMAEPVQALVVVTGSLNCLNSSGR